MERQLYIADQHINDRGVMVDEQFALNAIRLTRWVQRADSNAECQQITGPDNPNSLMQEIVDRRKMARK